MISTSTCILYLVIAVLLGYVIGASVMMHYLVENGEGYFIKWYQKAKQLEKESECPDEVEKPDGPIRGITMDQIHVQRFPDTGMHPWWTEEGIKEQFGDMDGDHMHIRMFDSQKDFEPEDDPIPELIDMPDLPDTNDVD